MGKVGSDFGADGNWDMDSLPVRGRSSEGPSVYMPSDRERSEASVEKDGEISKVGTETLGAEGKKGAESADASPLKRKASKDLEGSQGKTARRASAEGIKSLILRKKSGSFRRLLTKAAGSLTRKHSRALTAFNKAIRNEDPVAAADALGTMIKLKMDVSEAQKKFQELTDKKNDIGQVRASFNAAIKDEDFPTAREKLKEMKSLGVDTKGYQEKLESLAESQRVTEKAERGFSRASSKFEGAIEEENLKLAQTSFQEMQQKGLGHTDESEILNRLKEAGEKLTNLKKALKKKAKARGNFTNAIGNSKIEKAGEALQEMKALGMPIKEYEEELALAESRLEARENFKTALSNGNIEEALSDLQIMTETGLAKPELNEEAQDGLKEGFRALFDTFQESTSGLGSDLELAKEALKAAQKVAKEDPAAVAASKASAVADRAAKEAKNNPENAELANKAADAKKNADIANSDPAAIKANEDLSKARDAEKLARTAFNHAESAAIDTAKGPLAAYVEVMDRLDIKPELSPDDRAFMSRIYKASVESNNLEESLKTYRSMHSIGIADKEDLMSFKGALTTDALRSSDFFREFIIHSQMAEHSSENIHALLLFDLYRNKTEGNKEEFGCAVKRLQDEIEIQNTNKFFKNRK
ncbi:hypothetical protein SCG7109_AB_00460 [Chlamydiales bacterium SCGC AG-110-M15]|nr:hypothetical protein SCG7109_AB_00460 [Chlamydiales bacterium SCGC AG-110-M15]